MRILLIEDDEVLSDVLLQSLTQQRYAVDVIDNGKMGWEYAQSAEYDLILMDIGLPGLDGITLCQRLRSEGCATPILLITAKDATSERIKGLDAGADDYLIKPLDLGELQARVRALLRRGEGTPTPVLEVAGLKLDPSKGQAFYQDQWLKLTPKEYALLELFLRNPSRLFSRAHIMEHLWTFDDLPSEESVKAHVKGLRQKLKQAGAIDWIENIYGMGYRLHPQVVDQQATFAQPADRLSPDQSSPVAGSPINDAASSINSTSANSTATNSTHHTVEQQFNQAVSGLWQQYQGLMAQRMAALHQVEIAIQSGTALPPNLHQEATQAAHKLAGVLGMFGKDEGTKLAREIERILTDTALLELPSLPVLINRLDDQLALSTSNDSTSSKERATVPQTDENQQSLIVQNESQVLLIDIDPQFSIALQQIASSTTNLKWRVFSDLTEAKIWLNRHVPNLLILSIERNQHWQNRLALMADLAARTPSVPSIALTTTIELTDRVAIAQAGGQRILAHAATVDQVWDSATQLLQRQGAQQVKILVVDDDPILLTALSNLLQPWGIQMTGLSNPAEFWHVLESVLPSLLILDVEMPHWNGIELCQAVRTDPRWQELPILFLTARTDRQTVQQIFAAGADDYINKPLVGTELLTRINNRLERTRLVQTFFTREPITGLIYQPEAERILKRLMQQAAISQSAFSFIILAISDLDVINQQHGHAVGHQILQQWTRLLHTELQGAAMISYWGNGEFVVAMLGLNEAETKLYIDRVLRLLRQQTTTLATGDRLQVTPRWGIAQYPANGITVEALYQFSRNFSL